MARIIDHFRPSVPKPDPGVRNGLGEWRPAAPIQYAPVVVWPPRPLALMKWFISYPGFMWPRNLVLLAISILSYIYTQPALELCKTFEWHWLLQIWVRNLALTWLVYGGFHFYLYTIKGEGTKGKYDARWPATDNATFLFHNQVYDNIFWTSGVAVLIWTAYEAVTLWLFANNRIPRLTWIDHPVWFIVWFLAIPFWREFHFYWVHRAIHIKAIYKHVHSLHHKNVNPIPWSGMAMHPVETIIYLSVCLIHWIIPSHPFHFLFDLQHAALGPACGHHGFDGPILEDKWPTGSYFHYLHHRYFECNYGEATLPFDKWFGTFRDGTPGGAGARLKTEHQYKAPATSTVPSAYRKFVVDRIVPESASAKSIYLLAQDGCPLASYSPGQHLPLRLMVPGQTEPVYRFYTISDCENGTHYRLTIKKELPPRDKPDAPAGLSSSYFNDHVRVGDVIEAKAPSGTFFLDTLRDHPVAFIAGGIGVTPLLSMVNAVVRDQPHRDVWFVFALRHSGDHAFKDHLRKLTQKHPNIRYCVLYDQPLPEDKLGTDYDRAGRVDIPFLSSILPTLQMEYYICGPDQMMKAIVHGLQDAGVPKEKIRTESFGPASAAFKEGVIAPPTEVATDCTVTFQKSGKTMTWNPKSKTLWEFAEQHGVEISSGCLYGDCGTCLTQLVSGKVVYIHPTVVKPDPGTCLPCSCRPDGPIVIDA
jgi:ferredoxin-NADP reductase/sterol desaturase/sphingolipid hydroxylase (fatty acid hydroxylase superfamily)